MAGGGIKINNTSIRGGADGATFIPRLEGDYLKWSNNKGYQNPPDMYVKGPNGKDGTNGRDGKDGAAGAKGATGATGAKIVSQVLQGQDANGGNIYLQTFDDGTTATFVAPKGEKGEQGVQGEKGDKGDKGDTGAAGADGQTPYIKDGYWWIDGSNTEVKAEGQDGQTPYIKDGYWWIGDTNTGVKLEGQPVEYFSYYNERQLPMFDATTGEWLEPTEPKAGWYTFAKSNIPCSNLFKITAYNYDNSVDIDCIISNSNREEPRIIILNSVTNKASESKELIISKLRIRTLGGYSRLELYLGNGYVNQDITINIYKTLLEGSPDWTFENTLTYALYQGIESMPEGAKVYEKSVTKIAFDEAGGSSDIEIVQNSGDSPSAVMSQKATTDLVNARKVEAITEAISEANAETTKQVSVLSKRVTKNENAIKALNDILAVTTTLATIEDAYDIRMTAGGEPIIDGVETEVKKIIGSTGITDNGEVAISTISGIISTKPNILNIDEGLNEAFVKTDTGYRLTRIDGSRYRTNNINLRLKAGMDYVLSLKTSSINVSYQIAFEYEDRTSQSFNYSSYIEATPIHYNFEKNVKAMYISLPSEMLGKSFDINYIQLQMGKTATAYLPYEEPSVLDFPHTYVLGGLEAMLFNNEFMGGNIFSYIESIDLENGTISKLKEGASFKAVIAEWEEVDMVGWDNETGDHIVVGKVYIPTNLPDYHPEESGGNTVAPHKFIDVPDTVKLEYGCYNEWLGSVSGGSGVFVRSEGLNVADLEGIKIIFIDIQNPSDYADTSTGWFYPTPDQLIETLPLSIESNKYIAYRGGTESIKGNENEQYGALPTIVQDYYCIRGGFE